MNYPVVFVPGVLGSMGDDIIPGTGDLDFGLAKYVYDPFVSDLRSLGYKKDKDLFIAFYNWRQENLFSAYEYLIPVIKKAKKISGKGKVNLVCHSMGGIVSRSYIQSSHYNYDVDKLIMLGTPNAGSARAYYFWEGGEVPYKKLKSNIFFRLLWEGAVWIFRKLYNIKDDLTLLHEIFPSIKELMPTLEYGDYLVALGEDNFLDLIPINKMKVQNDFLNNLNRNAEQIYRRGVKVYLIAGKGVETEKFLCVEKSNDSSKWIDGIPSYSVNTDNGDGTVTCHSCTAIYGNVKYFDGDHTEILGMSKYELANILCRRAKRFEFTRRKRIQETDNLCSIVAADVENIFIKTNENITQKVTEIEDENVLIKKIGENIFWIIINMDLMKDVQMQFVPTKDMTSSILVIKGNEHKTQDNKVEIETKEIYHLNLN